MILLHMFKPFLNILFFTQSTEVLVILARSATSAVTKIELCGSFDNGNKYTNKQPFTENNIVFINTSKCLQQASATCSPVHIPLMCQGTREFEVRLFDATRRFMIPGLMA